ncbi:MAG TPA: DUF1508 domain-containing protein [Bacteroidetes bacterium]|nr:DUF1508 domain-containing protein [Bacteroidota bacterium]
MVQKSENYQNNFGYEDAALSNLTGFVSFQSPQDKEHYFRFNDENGSPVLFSEGYGKIAGRENGIRSVLKNARDPKRYKVLEEEGKWVVTLRAGNHQEIARTRRFSKKSEAKKMVKWLVNNVVATGQGKPKTVGPDIAVAKKAVSAPKPDTTTADDPKYTFRIELYPRHNEPLAGVITNLLNDKSEKFRGVESTVISRFITQNLSDKDKNLLPKPNTVKPVAKATAKKTDKPAQALPATENLTVELVDSPDGKPHGNWATDKFVNVRFSLKDGASRKPGEKVKMSVGLYPLLNPKMAVQLTTEVEFTNGKSAFIKDLQMLKDAGIYRLRAVSAGGQMEDVLFGTTALHVYDCPNC